MNAGSFSTSYSLNINRGTTAVIDALVVINSSLGRLGVDARYDTGQLHRPSGATYAGYATLISTAETAVPDTGSVDIPITALRTDPGTSRPDFVRVRRVALNPIPGATTGSVIYMGVRNSVDIVVDGI